MSRCQHVCRTQAASDCHVSQDWGTCLQKSLLPAENNRHNEDDELLGHCLHLWSPWTWFFIWMENFWELQFSSIFWFKGGQTWVYQSYRIFGNLAGPLGTCIDMLLRRIVHEAHIYHDCRNMSPTYPTCSKIVVYHGILFLKPVERITNARIG